MKKIKVLLIALLFIIPAAVIKNSLTISIGPKNAVFETKENAEGPVSVTVTPLSLRDFEVSLNTHSEELSVDLVAVSELVDDRGKVYKPLIWEGDPPTGHHREGVLKFNPITSKPKSIELKIENVGGVTERSFKWDL